MRFLKEYAPKLFKYLVFPLLVLSEGVAASSAERLLLSDPVNYVRVCDAFGKGYHYIPGTETCLKFSGYVRAEIGVKERGHNTNSFNAEDTVFFDREIEFVADAASMTEIGLVTSRFVLNNNKEDTLSLRDAWITIGENILVGRERSRYDFGGGYGIFYGFYTDEALNQFTYIMPLGKGVSATLGLEDGRDRQAKIAETTTGPTFSKNITYGGMKIPEIVASLRVSQAWGSAQLSGTVHQIRADTDRGTFEEFGFAVQAGTELKFGKKTKLKFVAAYADGAMRYIGGRNIYEAQLSDTASDIEETLDGWYVLGALNQKLSKKLTLETTASFHDFIDQADIWQLGATLYYQPVRELRIRLGAMYEGYDYDDTVLGSELSKGEDDNWEVKLRVQRNF
ncbi:MAG: porin [Hyphomicrobiales bacterium]